MIDTPHEDRKQRFICPEKLYFLVLRAHMLLLKFWTKVCNWWRWHLEQVKCTMAKQENWKWPAMDRCVGKKSGLLIVLRLSAGIPSLSQTRFHSAPSTNTDTRPPSTDMPERLFGIILSGQQHGPIDPSRPSPKRAAPLRFSHPWLRSLTGLFQRKYFHRGVTKNTLKMCKRIGENSQISSCVQLLKVKKGWGYSQSIK